VNAFSVRVHGHNFVTMDSHGESIHDTVEQQSNQKLKALLDG
jgi:tartrate dehydratase beta subunit/fumarate hydratase class I family protein